MSCQGEACSARRCELHRQRATLVWVSLWGMGVMSPPDLWSSPCGVWRLWHLLQSHDAPSLSHCRRGVDACSCYMLAEPALIGYALIGYGAHSHVSRMP